MKAILFLFLILGPNILKAELPAKFVGAIHKIETNGRTGAILGDNGKALGPLQIHKTCWRDANVKGNYSQCADLQYSAKVMESYLNRFCPKAVRENNFEIMARTWNGGPGYNSKTDNYWRKVKSSLDAKKK